MPTPNSLEITQLLLAWSDGDKAVLDQLMPRLAIGQIVAAEKPLRKEAG